MIFISSYSFSDDIILVGIYVFEFNNGMHFSYSGDGKLLCLSNELAQVEYQYSSDCLEVGYVIELASGQTFSRNTVRDTYRRGLLMNIASAMNGSQLEGLSYGYDALNRTIARNSDIFGYNERSEVTGATVSGSAAEYAYDEIGNSATYTANNLNQYSQFQYDLDGNILSDGVHMFTYDSVGRLKTVLSNGVLLVTNHYDAKSRRVKKVTPGAATTFFYDDWNLIEERIAYADGTTSTVKYYWGKDLSGSLQGAGGVGGLLYLTVDGVIYIPCYDNNGNITKYVDANGNVVASYTYDAFGKLIAKADALADFFRHRFSTKYFDVETELYYYGYRFYSPYLMRWLNRDPIEEKGGLNLYGFCGNNGVHNIDFLGERIEIKEDNLIVRDKISSTARAAFFPSADVTFSCSWNGVLSIDGVACRRIEIQTPDQERWNTRNKNYNKKWGQKEQIQWNGVRLTHMKWIIGMHLIRSFRFCICLMNLTVQSFAINVLK